MKADNYSDIRAPIDDEYTEDMTPLPFKQPPTLTRKQAAMVWREERDMMFYSLLMVETTSYRAYITDDLRNATVKERNFRKWSQQIEADRLQREKSFERMRQEVEEHRKTTAEGRTES